MGVDPENNWKAHYEILPGKEKVVDELKAIGEKWLTPSISATDWIERGRQLLGIYVRPLVVMTVATSEWYLTKLPKKGYQGCFETPSELDLDRVNAQQARRFFRPRCWFHGVAFAWAKVARGLSAGACFSRLLCV